MSITRQHGSVISIQSDALPFEPLHAADHNVGLAHVARRFLKAVVNHDRQEARCLKSRSRDRRITSGHRSEHLQVLGARSEARACDLELEEWS